MSADTFDRAAAEAVENAVESRTSSFWYGHTRYWYVRVYFNFKSFLSTLVYGHTKAGTSSLPLVVRTRVRTTRVRTRVPLRTCVCTMVVRTRVPSQNTRGSQCTCVPFSNQKVVT